MKIKINDDQKWIAIDVALIPEKKAWEELIKLNRALGVGDRSFHFDHNHQPHLTLWQDFVLSSEIENLSQKLSKQTWDIPAVLEFNGLNNQAQLAPGSHTPCLELEASHPCTQALLKLHRHVAELCRAHGGQGRVARGDFFGEAVHEKCHHYVQQFGDYKSDNHFFPHLTLGVGPDILAIQKMANSMTWPWRAKMDALVLAQLGDVCTVSSQIFWEQKI